MRPYLLWLATTLIGMSGGLFAAILVVLAIRALRPQETPDSLGAATVVAAYLAWVLVSLGVSWVGWRRFVRPRRD
ncbi:MAG TPA: hypothetical protein VFH63_00745 [candidate division Zixibacteria bacterium]|nr:hypothetical protein [candidate division Zixibacteria bacterium]